MDLDINVAVRQSDERHYFQCSGWFTATAVSGTGLSAVSSAETKNKAVANALVLLSELIRKQP